MPASEAFDRGVHKQRPLGPDFKSNRAVTVDTTTAGAAVHKQYHCSTTSRFGLCGSRDGFTFVYIYVCVSSVRQETCMRLFLRFHINIQNQTRVVETSSCHTAAFRSNAQSKYGLIILMIFSVFSLGHPRDLT